VGGKILAGDGDASSPGTEARLRAFYAMHVGLPDMTYRVYSGPKGSEDISPLKKSSMLFKEFARLDEALSWARHVEQTGRVPLLIEGDDGTRMDRRDIVDAVRVSAREQVGRKAD
jgi:hypothetical protein